MNPEQLRRLVLAGEPGELAAALAPLSVAERKKLSKHAQQLHREIDRGVGSGGDSITITELLELLGLKSSSDQQTFNAYGNAVLAVIGVGPLSAAKRVATRFWDKKYEDALIKILTDRRPDWLGEWVEHQLDGRDRPITWKVVRALTCSGACAKPSGDGYIRLFADEFNQWHGRDGSTVPPLSQRLLDEPDLLEGELWRLFETETDAFTHDWAENHPQIGPEHESWSTALVKLAQQGRIDRQRLLDATLRGLSSGFHANVLSGLHKLHARLEPEPEEIAARESDYRGLLSNRVPHVVSFALKMLRVLESKRRLDDERFLDEAETVFALSTKGPARTVLGMARRCVARTPQAKPRAIEVATRALTHPAPDVQESALELLEGWLDEEHRDAAARIVEYVDHVASALRPRLEALAGKAVAGPGESSEAPAHDLPTFSVADLAELRRRIEALDPTTRSRVGLDRNGNGVEPPALPPPPTFDLVEVPVLSGLERVQPIETLDELIDAVAHAVETVDSTDEVERILDGLSRLCAERPPDFELRTGALKKRVEQPVVAEAVRGLISGWGGICLVLGDLVWTWLSGERRETQQSSFYSSAPIHEFIMLRLVELTDRVHRRQAAPLLAAPTHTHGWIEPAALVHRALELESNGVPVPRADAVQSLLRLAPDGRREALRNAAAIPGVFGRSLRWALGGDEGPGPGDKRDHDLWISAGRARDPRGSLREVLVALEADTALPDGVEPAEWDWVSRLDRREHYGKTYNFPKILIRARAAGVAAREDTTQEENEATQDGFPGVASPTSSVTAILGELKKFVGGRRSLSKHFVPTVDLHRTLKRSWHTADLGGGWLIRWVSMVWPLNADASFAAGAGAMMDRIDTNASSTSPNFAFIEPLFEPDRPWTEMARLAVWTALVGKDADTSGLATDALIEGIEDGRVHPEPMARVLVRIAEGGWLKSNRLAESLAPVARTSLLHGRVVAEILEQFLADCRELPRNPHHLLELLLDLRTELGSPPHEATVRRLAELRGGGKAAKLARALCELQPAPNGAIEQAWAQAVATRLDRAERWSDG